MTPTAILIVVALIALAVGALSGLSTLTEQLRSRRMGAEINPDVREISRVTKDGITTVTRERFISKASFGEWVQGRLAGEAGGQNALTNIGPRLVGANANGALLQNGNPPLANSAGTRTSNYIDRLFTNTTTGQIAMAQSAKLFLMIGAITGTPTNFSLSATIQHCATSGGSYASYTDPITNATAAITITTSTTLTAQEFELSVNLSAAFEFLKIVEVLSFTSGSSPACPCSELLVLGGFPYEAITA
jgi:hypothetical protein